MKVNAIKLYNDYLLKIDKERLSIVETITTLSLLQDNFEDDKNIDILNLEIDSECGKFSFYYKKHEIKIWIKSVNPVKIVFSLYDEDHYYFEQDPGSFSDKLEFVMSIVNTIKEKEK